MQIKLQDFAKECGVTDRAIQKHIQKHEEDLRGHFERRGPNGTWLDDFAQGYIRDLMVQPSSPVVADAMLVRENKDLQQANSELKVQLQAYEKMILELRKENGLLNQSIGRLEASEETQKLFTDRLEVELERSRQETLKEREGKEALQMSLAASQAQNAALKNRGLVARILNKDVEI